MPEDYLTKGIAAAKAGDIDYWMLPSGPPNTSLQRARLARGKLAVPYLPGCARMTGI